MRIKVYAKVNLVLNITGRDGLFHTLDMIESNISLYDVVEIEKNETNDVNIMVNSNTPNFNLEIYLKLLRKVIDKVFAKYGEIGLDISVTKNIPLGAGLGGGSAPIVGIIKGIENILHVKMDEEILLSLGSDVPYMYKGGWARVSSLGDRIELLDGPKLQLLLAIPDTRVNTKECYNKYDKICVSSIRRTDKIDSICKDIKNINKHALFNDLENPAKLLNSDIDTLFDEFKNNNLVPHMSGSGSAVFCIINPNTMDVENVIRRLKGKGIFVSKFETL